MSKVMQHFMALELSSKEVCDMFPPKSQNGMKADGDIWLSGVKM